MSGTQICQVRKLCQWLPLLNTRALNHTAALDPRQQNRNRQHASPHWARGNPDAMLDVICGLQMCDVASPLALSKAWLQSAKACHAHQGRPKLFNCRNIYVSRHREDFACVAVEDSRTQEQNLVQLSNLGVWAFRGLCRGRQSLEDSADDNEVL